MTKETKIGLLVGCFVIILIGILISDHLAKAQFQEPAQIAQGMLEGSESNPISILPEYDSNSDYSASDYGLTPRSQPVPLPQEIAEPEPAIAIEPYRIRQDVPPVPMPARIGAILEEDTNPARDGEADALDTSTGIFGAGITPAQALPNEFAEVSGINQPTEPRGESASLGFNPNAPRNSGVTRGGGVEFVNPNGRGLNRDRLVRPGTSQINLNAAQASVVPTIAIPAPKIVWHTIKDGETLSDVSRIYYNTSKHYQKIADANKKQIPNVDRVRQGVRIIIPVLDNATPAVIRASNAVRVQAPATTAIDVRRELPVPNQPLGEKTYTLQENDTLSSVAAKFYGTSKAWHKLYMLNKDRIADPDRVKPGMVIKVPAR